MIPFLIAFVVALIAVEVFMGFGEAMSDSNPSPLTWREHSWAAAVAIVFGLVVAGAWSLLASLIWHG